MITGYKLVIVSNRLIISSQRLTSRLLSRYGFSTQRTDLIQSDSRSLG